jgi:hypothetical protein
MRFHLSSRFVCVDESSFGCAFMGSYPRFPDVLHGIPTANGWYPSEWQATDDNAEGRISIQPIIRWAFSKLHEDS